MKKQTILRGFHRPLALLPAFMREKIHDNSNIGCLGNLLKEYVRFTL